MGELADFNAARRQRLGFFEDREAMKAAIEAQAQELIPAVREPEDPALETLDRPKLIVLASNADLMSRLDILCDLDTEEEPQDEAVLATLERKRRLFAMLTPKERGLAIDLTTQRLQEFTEPTDSSQKDNS